MSGDSYEIARERASGELAEIDAEIQRLNRRKGQLERLTELLKELNTEFLPGAIVVEPPVGSAPEGVKAPGGDSTRAYFKEAEGLEGTTQEVRTLAAHLEMLHEHEQARARNAEEISDTRTGEEGPPIPVEEIAQLAYRYWTERGCPNGFHEQDWFRAEQELHRAIAGN